MKANAVVNLDCNVQIQTLDRYGKVVRTSRKHNKASVHLVDGLLRFLKGDFSETLYNSRQAGTTPSEAEIYIPVNAQFGRIGVKLSGTSSSAPIDRRFDYIDTDEFVIPTFDSYKLQEPIIPPETSSEDFKKLMKFSRISQVGYTDNNNAECLEFSLYLNPGKLVGYVDDDKKFIPYDWSYYNPRTEEYEAMLTEVGLMSSSNVLLARVLFDGQVSSEEFIDSEGVNHGKYPVFDDNDSPDNPIIQSQSTTLVLIWRIGIVSVGKNDDFVTQNNLSTQQFTNQFSEWVLNYITEVTGLNQDKWKKGYTVSKVRNDVKSKVSALLNGNSTQDLNKEV